MKKDLILSISMDDARHILGEAFNYAMNGAVKYGECPICKKDPVETVIRDLWLDPRGDIIVNGWCRGCKFKRQRIINTREYPEAHNLAMNLRELRIDVLGNM